MKFNLSNLVFSSLALLWLNFSSCNKPINNINNVKLTDLKRLEGSWVKNIDSLTTLTESWNFTEKDTIRIKTKVVKREISKSDSLTTLFSEHINVYKFKENLIYEAFVFGNPGGVKFTLTRFDSVNIVFENPLHDFPQKISYISRNQNKLAAMIEGKDDQGKIQAETILMTKE